MVVIKSGRSEASAKAAATHTGALAGSDASVAAAFRRAGLVRVEELEDLFTAAETLTCLKPVAGNEILIVTNGGGAGVLAVDDLVQTGGALAKLKPDLLAKLDAILPANLVSRQSRSTSSATQRPSATPPPWRPFSSRRECQRHPGDELPDGARLFDRRGAKR